MLEGITEYIQRKVVSPDRVTTPHMKANVNKMMHRKNCFTLIKDQPIRTKLSNSLDSQFYDKKINNTLNINGINITIKNTSFSSHHIDLTANVGYDFDPIVKEGEEPIVPQLYYTQKESYTPSSLGKEITRNLWHTFLMTNQQKFYGYGILNYYNKVRTKMNAELFFSSPEISKIMDYSTYNNLSSIADPAIGQNRNCRKPIREILQSHPTRELMAMNVKNPLLFNDASLFVPENLDIKYNASGLFSFNHLNGILCAFYKGDYSLKDKFTMSELLKDINEANKPFQYVNEIDEIINLLSKHHIEFALSFLDPNCQLSIFDTQSQVLNIPKDLLDIWESSYPRSSTEYCIKDFLGDIFGATLKVDLYSVREKLLKLFHFIIHINGLNDNGSNYIIDENILIFLQYLYYTQLVNGINKYMNNAYDHVDGYKDRACFLGISTFKLNIKSLFKDHFTIDETEVKDKIIINKILDDCIAWKDQFIKDNASETFVDPAIMYPLWQSRLSSQSYAA